MKYIILSFLYALPALAQQGNALGTLRDHKVIELMDRVNKYCEESYPQLLKEKDGTFLCYLQLEADSKHAEGNFKDFAGTIRNQVRFLEVSVVGMQGNAGQISKTYIGSEIERIKDPCKFNPKLAECNSEGNWARGAADLEDFKMVPTKSSGTPVSDFGKLD